jgi:ATP-dependent exoDNAse (exonuclease V) beta subunit
VQSVNKDAETSFFCVGDLKQAIYSWRGGVAEIFEAVGDFLEQDGTGVHHAPVMSETRRNAQPVINVVNRVFLHIRTNAAVCEKSSLAAAKWQEWFGSQKHETLNAAKGYCLLEAAPADSTTVDGTTAAGNDDSEEADTTSPFWQYTLDRIEQLHQKHPNRSIGVLFRANKHISTVLKGLHKRNIEASDEGGIPLTDSAAVQQILSVMTLIDHPGGTVARFHLANGPLADLLPLQNYADGVEAEKTAHRWRKKLLSQGYGKTVRELIPALTPCDPKESQRLEKLLELAYRFDEQAFGTRTRQFIETVNAERLASPSAARVRVMTIHKAKGLEFDIVVLPDLDGQLVGMPPKIIVSKNSPTEPVNFVLRWVNQDLRVLLPDAYRKAFVQWQDNQVKESLAVLYVAMTRARHELVMIVPEKSRRGISTYAGVLQAGLNVTAAQNSPILYQDGDADWDKEIEMEKPEPPAITWNALANQPLQRNLPRATPSGMELELALQHTEAKASQSSTGSATVSRYDAALRGTAIHACFAHVRWLEDGNLDAKTLQKIVGQSISGKRGSVDSSEVVSTFLAMCQKPEVRAVLLRSSYPAAEDVDVESERRFAVRWQNKLLHGSMDRLVIRRLGNEVIGLEIIDFKSDRPLDGEAGSDFLAERTRIYAPQIEAYKHAAAKLYPNVQSISAKLVFVSADEVVVLENLNCP